MKRIEFDCFVKKLVIATLGIGICSWDWPEWSSHPHRHFCVCLGGDAFGWRLGMRNEKGSVLLAKLKKKTSKKFLPKSIYSFLVEGLLFMQYQEN